MKPNKWLLLLALALITGISSCKHDEVPDTEPNNEFEITTYMGLNIRMSNEGTRAEDDDLYNKTGIYNGFLEYRIVDVYIISGDGSKLLMSQRFTRDQLTPVAGQTLRLAVPFKAAPGPVQITVIMNSPNPLHSNVPPADWMYTKLYSDGRLEPKILYGSSNPAGATWARTFGAYALDNTPVYVDEMVLVGKNENFIVKEGVTPEMVLEESQNIANITLARLPARVFLTKQSDADSPEEDSYVYDSRTGETIGQLKNLTWAVAQTANASYLYPKTVGDFNPGAPNAGTTYSWGYDFVPTPSGAAGADYAQARDFYDYNDLLGDPRPIPLLESMLDEIGGGINYWSQPGIFVAETTHERGVDAASSKYKKGNTAYILVRGTFRPDVFVGNKWGNLQPELERELPADGTFYIGATDRLVYASAADARDPVIGMLNQDVMMYPQGKVLYFMWLNPDENANDPNFDKPINSPVVRNNIYHANIRGFSSIGFNWNPLVPPGGVNPDPKPENPYEPVEPPLNPTDPLSDFDTYMSVEITVLNWGFHSYEVDL